MHVIKIHALKTPTVINTIHKTYGKEWQAMNKRCWESQRRKKKRDHKLASSPLQIVYFFLDTHKNMGILSFTFIDCLFSFLAIPKENNPCTNKLNACLLANACARKKNRKKKSSQSTSPLTPSFLYAEKNIDRWMTQFPVIQMKQIVIVSHNSALRLQAQ